MGMDWGGKSWTFDGVTWELLGDGEFPSNLTLSGSYLYAFSPLGTTSVVSPKTSL
jgi:hypothetical protein